jgi:hypothetical protein
MQEPSKVEKRCFRVFRKAGVTFHKYEQITNVERMAIEFLEAKGNEVKVERVQKVGKFLVMVQVGQGEMEFLHRNLVEALRDAFIFLELGGRK